MKKLTPTKALALLQKKAKKLNKSLGGYCESKGISRSIVNTWRARGNNGTVLYSTLEKLGLL